MKLRTEFTKDPIYQVAIKIDGALDTVAIVKEVADAEKLVLAYNSYDELLDMVKYFLIHLEHADYSNGVTDPTGSIDEGRVWQARDIEKVKAIIAKAKGE